MPSPSRKASSKPAASQSQAKPAPPRSDDKHLVKVRLTAEQHKILRLAAAIREQRASELAAELVATGAQRIYDREAPDRNA